MRRIVVLLSAFVLAGAIGAADAQTDLPAKRAGGRHKASQRPATPPPDTRPRFKRDDTPGAVVAAPAKPPAVARKKRSVRKPADAAPPTADQPARATARDIAACAQNKENEVAIAGCTRVIDDNKVKPKGRAAAYYNRGNANSAKGDFAAATSDYDEALKLDPK